jgi:hypothetical protein
MYHCSFYFCTDVFILFFFSKYKLSMPLISVEFENVINSLKVHHVIRFITNLYLLKHVYALWVSFDIIVSTLIFLIEQNVIIWFMYPSRHIIKSFVVSHLSNFNCISVAFFCYTIFFPNCFCSVHVCLRMIGWNNEKTWCDHMKR